MTNVDIQLIASNAYNLIMNLNSMATSLVGLDSLWCRLLPYSNSADVIVLEYTLTSYECPKLIKVISGNANYNIGNFNIDLFGMHAESTLEISIDINDWNALYGENSMPLKGDFVYIKVMHRAYEVKSSSIVYTIGQKPTSYKCILGEWKHSASRQETEDFKTSIDELTISQDRLFGEEISKEVADAVIEVETAYNTTTYVDPIKDFDIDSIVMTDNYGINGNLISNAHYNFRNATKNITYNVNAYYDVDALENHFIYSCWFKYDVNSANKHDIKIKKLYLKEKDYWFFEIQPDMQVYEGMNISISRSLYIKLNGVIRSKDCETGWVIQIPSSDCFIVNKKYPQWWDSGIWKMETQNLINLISLNIEDQPQLRVDIDTKNLFITTNVIKKLIDITKIIHNNDWHYFAIDVNPNNIRILLIEEHILNTSGKHVVKTILDTEEQIKVKNFSFDNATIENKGLNVQLSNIRLYENEYELGDTYKIDMYSQITKNASKLILVDSPKPVNKQNFVSIPR